MVLLSKMALAFTADLEGKGIIEEADGELYLYGIRQGFSFLFNIISTLFLGFLLGMPAESMIFMLFYIPLRCYAGGYHEKTPLRCYILSMVTVAFMLFGLRFVPFPVFIAAAVASAALIFRIAPIGTKNKVLSEDERVHFSKKTRTVLFLEIMVVTAAVFLNVKIVVLCACAAMVLSAALLIKGAEANKRM